MPTISMFYGIIISMFFEIKEKHHLPHIHVRYQSCRASVAIEDGALLADWELAKEGVEPFRIDPLK
jgi:hypothetical protein